MIDPTTIAQQPAVILVGVLAVALAMVSMAMRFVDASSPAQRMARVTALAATVVALAIVVFITLAAGLSGDAGSIAFDEALATALSRLPPSTLASLLALVTHLGDRATLIACTAAIGLLLLGIRRYGPAVAWIVTCAGNGLLNPALKAAFARARPVHEAAYATVGEYSFPSGHTSGSVVVYGMLAYVATRVAPVRWHVPIVLVTTTVVVVVGFSRIWLRVHWASDVFAGLASGAAWLAVCIVVAERLRTRAGSLSPS